MQNTCFYQLNKRTRLTCLSTDHFKTAVVGFAFTVPLQRENAAEAIVPYLLRRGTERYPDLNIIGGKLDDLFGASIEPYVRRVGNRLAVGLLADFLDDRVIPTGGSLAESMIDLLHEMVFQPHLENGVFPRTVFESEQKNLRDRIAGLKNDLRSYAVRRGQELFYGDSGYGDCEFGTVDGANALTEEAVREAYRKLCDTAEIELFYSGSMDGEAAAALFRRYLPADCSIIKNRIKPYHMTAEPQTIVEEMKVTQGKLTICLPTGCGEAEYPALLMFQTILGGYTGSRLFCNVREKQSLCYYASAQAAKSTGVITISSGIQNEMYETAKDAILSEVTALQDGPVTEEEFENAKRTLINMYRSLQDTPEGLERYWMGQALCGSADTPQKTIDRLQKVTIEEMREAGRKARVCLVYFIKGVGV